MGSSTGCNLLNIEAKFSTIFYSHTVICSLYKQVVGADMFFIGRTHKKCINYKSVISRNIFLNNNSLTTNIRIKSRNEHITFKNNSIILQ